MLLNAVSCQHPGQRPDDAQARLAADAEPHHGLTLQNDRDDFVPARQAFLSDPVILTTYSVLYSHYGQEIINDLIVLTVAAIRVCCRLFIPLILFFLFNKTELKANHILLEDMQCKKKWIRLKVKGKDRF